MRTAFLTMMMIIAFWSNLAGTTSQPSHTSPPPSSGTYGISIPAQHPTLWFTPARLAQAKGWYSSHPLSVKSSDTLNLAFRHLMTGNAADCSGPISWALQNIPTLTHADPMRWSGELVIITYDWCYDQLDSATKANMISGINAAMDQWAPNMSYQNGASQDNYFAGILRNELEWAITSYNDQPAKAQTYLDNAFQVRWPKFLSQASTLYNGGIMPEGIAYGRYIPWYSLVPMITAALNGRDMLSESAWYQQIVYYFLYSTTPAPTSPKALYELFPTGDENRNWWLAGGTAAASDTVGTGMPGTYQGDVFATMINRLPRSRLAGYAKQWLVNTGATQQNFMASVDTQTSATAPLPFSNLPLDYYASGISEQSLFAHSNSKWSSATEVMLKGAHDNGGATHQHNDIGSFQFWRKGYWLSINTIGYQGADNFAPWKGVAPAWQANTRYGLNDRVLGGSTLFTQIANAPCTSGTSTPAWNLKSGLTTTVDGTCTWLNMAVDGYSGKTADAGKAIEINNGILINGVGLAIGPVASSKVLRLESNPAYSYMDVDLTQEYLGNNPYRPYRGNNWVAHVERDMVFLRSIETLVVLDRVQSKAYSGAPNITPSIIPKTFVAHCAKPWSLEDSTHSSCTNGSQVLSVTTLLPTSRTKRVIDEGNCNGCNNTVTSQSRLEIDGSGGQALSYQLNVLQAHDLGSPAVTVSNPVDSNPSDPTTGTITLVLTPSGGQPTTIVFQKGATLAGNSQSETINPDDSGVINALTTVQPVTYDINGITWH
jgi:hypothetical protein